ncbi:MAG TPA: universal stress protein [Mycobacterium sp.]|nr:universal stress protein [Mycobacterium sp.]
MSNPYPSSPCVVVGIDGSRAAEHAALWAVDEAVDRDVPVLLLYAVDANNNDPDAAAAEIATADNAIRNVITKIESTGKPVKLESEVVHSGAAAALLEASRSATVLCVGSTGFKHAVRGRIGSTASTLATAAHCPVAIVSRTATPPGRGLVLAVVDASPASDTVLDRAVAEARLRDGALRVLTRRQQNPATACGPAADDRRVQAEIEHRLAHRRRNHPDLDIESVPSHGGLLNYLEQTDRSATPVQLVVVDPVQPGPVDTLLSPQGRAALDAARCTLLICDRRWWL